MRGPNNITARRPTIHRIGPRCLRIVACAIAFVLPAMTAAATEISGTVMNKTIGKPAVADEVVLINISADMQEAGRTRTDGSGNFQFHTSKKDVRWLIKVVHASVSYESVVSTENQRLEIAVFDTTAATAGITSGIQVLQLETDAGYLRTTEMFTLVNASSPPRTVQKEELFSLPLPPDSVLVSSVGEGPGEFAVKSIAVEPAKENRCYFNFPLRPGTTKIQLQYQVPYSGSYTFTAYVPFPADMLGIMMPASMQFQSPQPGVYKPEMDGNGGVVEFIRNARDGSAPPFTISGTGSMFTKSNSTSAILQDNAIPTKELPVRTVAGSQTSGLGKNLKPSETQLSILLVLVFAAGLTIVLYLHRRNLQTVTGSGSTSKPDAVVREQLFSLELDRLQNRISKKRYTMARSKLEKKLADILTNRTIQRQNSKTM